MSTGYLLLTIFLLVSGGSLMFYFKGMNKEKANQLEGRLKANKEKNKVNEKIEGMSKNEKTDLADNLWDE